MSYFSTPDSYERVYLSFDPMHRLMQERNITDLQLAQKVDVIRNTYKYLDTVTLSQVRSICEALDYGPGDLYDTAGPKLYTVFIKHHILFLSPRLAGRSASAFSSCRFPVPR